MPHALSTRSRIQRVASRPPTQPVVQLLNDSAFASWARYVEAHPDGTLFHTLAWRHAVHRAFGHAEYYLIATRSGAVVGALPLFLVASRIGGRMLISVPYGVGGGILADDADTVAALGRAALELADELRCPTIELRSERAVVPDWPIIDRYAGFRRDLPARGEDVLAWFPRKARAEARNARDKHQLTVHVGDHHLREVWRLYCLNMRRLASLAYPFRFFEGLMRATPGRHGVLLLCRNGRSLAGLVSFRFGDVVMPYFFGSTADAKSFNAANFAYYALAERAVTEGCRVFDFGRSRKDNTGSFNFKRFNGFAPTPLQYQRYSVAEASLDLAPSNPAFALGRRIWPFLPTWLTTFAGTKLSKHIPG
jgi:FemAB-related protein (PEP-CTERM system-associated)